MSYWLVTTAAMVFLLWATLLILTGHFWPAGWVIVLAVVFGAVSAEMKLRKEENDG